MTGARRQRARARPAAADLGRRLVLGPRVARAAEDRLLPAPHQRPVPATTSTKWPSRPPLKDQERAGVDIVSDGELRRDNDIDYFLARMPGVEIPHVAKTVLLRLLRRLRPPPDPGRRRARHARPGRRPPLHPGVHRPPGQVLASPARSRWRAGSTTRPTPNLDDLVLAFARMLNREAEALADAGAAILQIDEPFLAGYPEEVGAGGRGDQHRLRGRRRSDAGAARLLRQPLRPAGLGRPLRVPVPGHPRRPGRPARARVRPQGLPRPGAVQEVPTSTHASGLGVIDVKKPSVETAELIVSRVRQALAGRCRRIG